MSAKNSIRVKVQFEKDLLCAALAVGIKLVKCKLVAGSYVSYTTQVSSYQKLFELGYHFNKINRQNLSVQ